MVIFREESRGYILGETNRSVKESTRSRDTNTSDSWQRSDDNTGAEEERQRLVTGAEERRPGEITETDGHGELPSEDIERIILSLRDEVISTMYDGGISCLQRARTE